MSIIIVKIICSFSSFIKYSSYFFDQFNMILCDTTLVCAGIMFRNFYYAVHRPSFQMSCKLDWLLCVRRYYRLQMAKLLADWWLTWKPLVSSVHFCIIVDWIRTISVWRRPTVNWQTYGRPPKREQKAKSWQSTSRGQNEKDCWSSEEDVPRKGNIWGLGRVSLPSAASLC
jgi:hypothetical protein